MSRLLIDHRGKILGLVLAIVLLLLLYPGVDRYLHGSEEQVAYALQQTASACDERFFEEQEMHLCLSSFELVVGNTGAYSQEQIVLTIDPAPQLWQQRHSVFDIVASEQQGDPAISSWEANGIRTYEIRRLAPNQLVSFALSIQGREARASLASARISVSANGSVLRGDPRDKALSDLGQALQLFTGFL